MVRRAETVVARLGFTTSADYWEKRYRRGGTSGAGSYNRLAEFKAEVLNDFVRVNRVRTVIEFGSGDGAQVQLAEFPDYVGVDVSQTAISACRRRFAGDSSKRFVHTGDISTQDRGELALSLDVIYHLVEDEVFDSYMCQLFDAADRYVIVYSSNDTRDWPDPHVKHRRFTDWVDQNRPDFTVTERIPNRYPYSSDDPDNTSFADFYVFTRRN
ncbi:hypothetical protein BHQ18_20350 [Mycolicibacterium flavescens]|uniref:Methyltransferase type 11 domain-containing protein n=1 Tax=Mycolicibacterium flavescens TaxID=1776 RepID=A0A1E3RED6_MYCFV|nr:hypothetical protein BHQ18_20350 [Mycolicibacterium flavescens]